jgi:hypothetical protein
MRVVAAHGNTNAMCPSFCDAFSLSRMRFFPTRSPGFIGDVRADAALLSE